MKEIMITKVIWKSCVLRVKQVFNNYILKTYQKITLDLTAAILISQNIEISVSQL